MPTRRLLGLIRMEQLVSEATQAPMQTPIAAAADAIVSYGETPTGRQNQGSYQGVWTPLRPVVTESRTLIED